MPAAVKLSAAPIDWGVMELVRINPNPGDLLDCVADAGYTGCELGTHGYFGFDATSIQNFFTPRNLQVSASWYDVDLARPLGDKAAKEINEICALLQATGASILNISDKIVDERLEVVARVAQFPDVWWDEEDWAQVPHTLLAIHQLVSPRGITVAVHPHVATHIETGSEARMLGEAIEGTPLKICLDTGHLLLGGADPIAMLRYFGDRVVHVHAKDVDEATLSRLKKGEIDYMTATGQGLYSDLGTGVVDWEGLKSGLEAIEFDGWVVAEQDRLPVEGSRIPFDANKRNAAFLKSLFALG